MVKKKPFNPWITLRHFFETIGAFLVFGFFALLPAEKASALGGEILRRWGPRMGITRTARKNLKAAFPEKSADEIEEILLLMWDNLGRTVGEYPHLRDILDNAEIIGGEHLQAAKNTQGPVIFFGGHLANWEVQPVCIKRAGVDLHLVYRKPNNAGVDALLRRARDSGASGQIAKGRSGAREIVSILKEGGVVGMLVDQKMNEGLPIPFFGRDAMTAPAIAHFALKFNCPLYPTRVERLTGRRFRLTFYPPLPVENTGDMTTDARRIMTDINALIEGWVRERPGQWLWIHNRWPREKK